MAEKDVVITYETLFELLRIEKNREELQKLEPSFFDDVLEYLNDKKSKFESKQSQSVLFAADDKEKARLELENLKKILKELYDKREKKIVSTALNNARTGITLANTANMLPSEKALFNSVASLLTGFRKSILFKLASCERPDMDNLQGSVISSVNGGFEQQDMEEPEQQGPALSVDATSDLEPAPLADAPESAPQEPSEPKELKSTPSFSDSGANERKIRFLASIGEIVGPDLQIYGPYEEGAVISLPEELARVLLEKKQAEEVMN